MASASSNGTWKLPDSTSEIYVLRSAPGDRERILRAAKAALFKVDPNRVIDPDQMLTYTQIRTAYFQRDTTMIGLLIYKNAFEYSKFGLACAQAILLAIVIALISMLQFKLMGVDVEY